MIAVPDVTDAQVAFGETSFVPAWEAIPEEFRQGKTPWNELFNQLFYNIPLSGTIEPQEGVDALKAGRAIRAAMTSWGLKHEHKEAGVSYLMSQWFKDLDQLREGSTL